MNDPRRPVWVLETLLLLGALALANAALAPGDPGLLRLSPHPLHAVVALMAVRYGAAPGFGSGVLAALAHALGQLVALRASAPAAAAWNLDRLDATAPLLLVLVGAILGEVRERHRQSHLADRARADRARAECGELEARLLVQREARSELERRLASISETPAALFETALRVADLDERFAWEAGLDAACDHLGAEECAVYELEGKALRLRASRGAVRPPEERSAAEGLVGLALAGRRVASARDVLAGTAVDAVTVLAAPLLRRGPRDDVAVLGALVVTRMPFLRLTRGSLRLAQNLADWVARELLRGRAVAALRRESVHDAEAGLPGAAHLAVRLEEELARGRRDGAPFSLLALELPGWAELALWRRPPIARAVATVVLEVAEGATLCRAGPDGLLAAVLPGLGPAPAEVVRGRVTEVLDLLWLDAKARGLPHLSGVAGPPRPDARPAEVIDAARAAARARAVLPATDAPPATGGA